MLRPTTMGAGWTIFTVAMGFVFPEVGLLASQVFLVVVFEIIVGHGGDFSAKLWIFLENRKKSINFAVWN